MGLSAVLVVDRIRRYPIRTETTRLEENSRVVFSFVVVYLTTRSEKVSIPRLWITVANATLARRQHRPAAEAGVGGVLICWRGLVPGGHPWLRRHRGFSPRHDRRQLGSIRCVLVAPIRSRQPRDGLRWHDPRPRRKPPGQRLQGGMHRRGGPRCLMRINRDHYLMFAGLDRHDTNLSSLGLYLKARRAHQLSTMQASLQPLPAGRR